MKSSMVLILASVWRFNWETFRWSCFFRYRAPMLSLIKNRKEFKMVNPLRVRTSKKVKLSEKTPW